MINPVFKIYCCTHFAKSILLIRIYLKSLLKLDHMNTHNCILVIRKQHEFNMKILKPSGNVSIKNKPVVELTTLLNRGNRSGDFLAGGYETSFHIAKSVSAMCF